MAAEDQPDASVDLLTQLRGAVDRLNAVAARVPGVAQAASHLPSMPAFPAPGRTTALQISAVAVAVRAQRSAMQALRISLDAYEQQLEVLEELLEPLESLSQAWAQIESRVTGERPAPAGVVPTSRVTASREPARPRDEPATGG